MGPGQPELGEQPARGWNWAISEVPSNPTILWVFRFRGIQALLVVLKQAVSQTGTGPGGRTQHYVLVWWELSQLPVMNFQARLLASCGVRMLPPPWRGFSRAAEGPAVQRIRKVLCVAEKNDAARGIADLLSNSRMRRVGIHYFSLPHVPADLP